MSLTTISKTTQKARKQHVCDYCNGKIQIGETYQKSAIVNDGFFYTWKSHIRCKAIANELNMFDDRSDGLTFDDFIEEIRNEYDNLMSKNFADIYEAPEFKHPSFQEQLDFVCDFHKILNF